MKGNFVLALLLTAVLGAYAQLGTGESPVSFAMKDFDHSAVKTISMDKPDLERVMAEDASEEAFFKPRRFGVILPLGIDFFKEAQSMEVEGGRLWTLAVSVPEAQALIFYSSDFYLPEHSKLFIYNQERTRVLGAFSAFNNQGCLYPFLHCNEMMMDGAYGQKRRDCGMAGVYVPVGQNYVIDSVRNGFFRSLAQRGNRFLKSCRALACIEQHRQLDRVEPLVSNVAKDVQLGVVEDGMGQTDHFAMAFVRQ